MATKYDIVSPLQGTTHLKWVPIGFVGRIK